MPEPMPHKNTPTAAITPAIHRGYIEGYYGRLLSWQDRSFLLAHLSALPCDAYLYAPKEDIYHRRQWRTPYDADFIAHFSAFTAEARQADIRVLAGIAPGLDFNFPIPDTAPDAAPDTDKAALFAKADALIKAGADAIVLMFDDISDDLSQLEAAGLDEGVCHAQLASSLAAYLRAPVMLVPRLYSDEISGAHDAYAHALNQHLDPRINILLCGETIVAETVNIQGRAGCIGNQLQNPLIIWDNLYCNDYCPRRLFLGPYQGRRPQDPILLNGTGMPQTDALLLSLMCGQPQKQILRDAGVPDAIEILLPFFDLPVFSGQYISGQRGVSAKPSDIPSLLAAIETLLWEWKSPLALEWYPYLFGLKHDLLFYADELPEERLAKTQTPALSAKLLSDQK
jgi:protein O-GlcNAcase/histone acetyltransferase